MDTAHKTVTFRFSPDSDQPDVIAMKLVDQDCLTEAHMGAVVEQLEKVIEVVRENPEKSVGLRLTSVVEQNSDAVARRIPMEVHRPTTPKPPTESEPGTPVAQRAGRFFIAPATTTGSQADARVAENVGLLFTVPTV